MLNPKKCLCFCKVLLNGTILCLTHATFSILGECNFWTDEKTRSESYSNCTMGLKRDQIGGWEENQRPPRQLCWNGYFLQLHFPTGKIWKSKWGNLIYHLFWALKSFRKLRNYSKFMNSQFHFCSYVRFHGRLNSFEPIVTP